MPSNDYLVWNPLGHIEYGVIDVIGHRLGIKPELELIQADSIRIVIYAAIYNQIRALLKNQQNVDNIRTAAGIEIIRKKTLAETEKIQTLARKIAGDIDSHIFLQLLAAAAVDQELQLAISKTINDDETQETIQKDLAINILLPTREVVDCCTEDLIQEGLLDCLIDACNGRHNVEWLMYAPLADIFAKIQEQDVRDKPSNISREINSTETSKSFNHDDHDLNELERKPDFSILDVDPAADPNWTPLYRQMASFVEVKGKDSDGPVGPNKRVSHQCVNYASLIMTARPFNVFSIGIIIHGLKFTIMYADRAGICFSPEYSLKTHLKLFVRIIMRLTFYMNDYDVTDLSSGIRVWTTSGHPLFVARSVFGRGSSVWQAVGFDTQLCVLKCTWRSKNREYDESDIYRKIGPHSGIPLWLHGADVWANGATLSTRILRNREKDGLDCQLYRAAIQPLGKPLWEFTTELELLLGFRSALAGHRYMFEERGILHRDVNAGNVLLCDDKHPDHGHVRHGFLMDPELAWVMKDDDSLEKGEVVPRRNNMIQVHPLTQVRNFSAGTA